MKHAQLVQEYYRQTGHWPDVLFCDPVCIHHVSFELSILASMVPDLPPIAIRHLDLIPAGMGLACSFEQMLTFPQQLVAMDLPLYHAEFHAEACN